MRAAVIVFIGLIVLGAEVVGQSPVRVSDPYESENFSCTGKPDGRLHNDPDAHSGYNGFRIRGDLNFDDREDLILSSSDDVPCANSGCAVAVFLKQPDNKYIKLDYWLHPLAVALSMVRRGEGQFVTYGRVSGSEGAIVFHAVTSDSLKQTTKQTVHVNESPSDEALYASWFSGKMALKAEYSRCANGKLTWADSYGE